MNENRTILNQTENNLEINKWCVGLTGGLACGKTTVTRLLAEYGVTIIDADVIGRALTANPDSLGTIAARNALGNWAVDENGALRRDVIRQRIFADVQLRQQLESALHPLIQSAMHEELQTTVGPYTIITAPLLLESGILVAACARIAVIDCAPELQINRACTRDGITTAMATAIAAAQMPRQQRLERANDIIKNDGSLQELQKTVESFHHTWMGMAKNHASAA